MGEGCGVFGEPLVRDTGVSVACGFNERVLGAAVAVCRMTYLQVCEASGWTLEFMLHSDHAHDHHSALLANLQAPGCGGPELS